jgi:hypothetical protein
MLGHAPPPLTASGLDIRDGHPADVPVPFVSSEVLTPRRYSAHARMYRLRDGAQEIADHLRPLSSLGPDRRQQDDHAGREEDQSPARMLHCDHLGASKKATIASLPEMTAITANRTARWIAGRRERRRLTSQLCIFERSHGRGDSAKAL